MRISPSLLLSTFALLGMQEKLVALQPGFVSQQKIKRVDIRTTSSLHSLPRDNNQDEINFVSSSSRREILFRTVGLVGVVVGAGTGILQPEPAHATYSAYTHREQDWEERQKNGEINVKTARDLRKQLAEIAPMNNEGSKIFCPNGPSAAVSPLMENKCGDRLAIPSVYGRTEDTVGNSIPGFNSKYLAGMGGGASSSTNLAAELGNVGYGFTVQGKK